MLANRRHKRRNALLPIDQDLLAGRHFPVLQPNIRILPYDQISGGVSFIKRVQQIANLRLFPYKGTLNLRDSDIPTGDQAENGPNGS